MRLLSYSGTQNKFTGNKKKVVADLVCSNVPVVFPTTGKDIPGMGENFILLPGSTIWVINTAEVYALNEDGQWVNQ